MESSVRFLLDFEFLAAVNPSTYNHTELLGVIHIFLIGLCTVAGEVQHSQNSNSTPEFARSDRRRFGTARTLR
ncbi:MAG: hypothetical protein WD029_00750 [Microthrixaceae bacterium]